MQVPCRTDFQSFTVAMPSMVGPLPVGTTAGLVRLTTRLLAPAHVFPDRSLGDRFHRARRDGGPGILLRRVDAVLERPVGVLESPRAVTHVGRGAGQQGQGLDLPGGDLLDDRVDDVALVRGAQGSALLEVTASDREG